MAWSGYMNSYRSKSVITNPSKPHSSRRTFCIRGMEPPAQVAPMRLYELITAVQARISLSDMVPCPSEIYLMEVEAFFTVYSKGFRYSSRRACSLAQAAMPPPLTRLVSWSLTAKCLMVQ